GRVRLTESKLSLRAILHSIVRLKTKESRGSYDCAGGRKISHATTRWSYGRRAVDRHPI
ncbi:hypothetical protein B296_00041604, partial [Ensete ventricosum]